MRKQEVKLTSEQAQILAPYEKYFGMVHRASYCIYPGEQALQTMRDVWEQATGQKRQWHGGCPECIMNLVRDLGTLYYAATGRKPEDSIPSKVVKVGGNVESPAANVEIPAANVESKPAPVAEKKPAAPKKKKPAPKKKKASNAKK